MDSINHIRSELAATAADPFQIAAEALDRCRRLEQELNRLRLLHQTPAFDELPVRQQ